MNEKPDMKIVYYAALNGGSVENVYNLYNHLKVYSIKNDTALVNSRKAFAENMFKSQIMAELKTVYQLWESFNGIIYIPTRVKPVQRLYTEEKANKINKGRQLGDPKYVYPGNPATKRLPTLVYTSLEVMFIQRVIGVFN